MVAEKVQPESKPEDTQLPTPPAEDDEMFSDQNKHASTGLKLSPKTSSKQDWRPPTMEYWENSSTSPASTPPPLDDLELPSFEEAQQDPIIASNLTPLELSSTQFDFPDPTVSGGSPSSVRAEFDQESQDLEMDSDDSDRRNWKSSRNSSQEDIFTQVESGLTEEQAAEVGTPAQLDPPIV
jgi:ubiquitin carboxyl-terminal hydrolase 4/11